MKQPVAGHCRAVVWAFLAGEAGDFAAAPSLLVTEAGGKFTCLTGEYGPHTGWAVASKGLLHDSVLGILNSAKDKAAVGEVYETSPTAALSLAELRMPRTES